MVDSKLKETVKIFTDGASRGNPGPASYGIYIKINPEESLGLKGTLGIQTNNFAEYTAVLEALRWMVQNKFKDAELNSDSELLIKQMRGEYKVKSEVIKPLHEEAHKIIKSNNLNVKFNHVRREFNKEADRLANQALDEV
jgi:ribonuclease HI